MTAQSPREALANHLDLWRAYLRPDANPTEMELWGALRTVMDFLPDLLKPAPQGSAQSALDAVRALVEKLPEGRFVQWVYAREHARAGQVASIGITTEDGDDLTFAEVDPEIDPDFNPEEMEALAEWWATAPDVLRAALPVIERAIEDGERDAREREHLLQQAQSWAQEARTQRATVREVGSVLGGVPDWGPIATMVAALRAEVERLQADRDHWREANRASLSAGDVLKAEVERLKGERDEALAAMSGDGADAVRMMLGDVP